MNELIEMLRRLAEWPDEADPVTIGAIAGEAAGALEAAQEDAERYRWLRSLDGSCDAAACVNINIGFDWIEQHGADLDAAIDQARGKGVAE